MSTRFCKKCQKENRDESRFCSGCGASLVDALPYMPLKIGAILEDRYKVITQINAGGMSAIYKAQVLKLNSVCAIKELHPVGTKIEQTEMASWFKREAKFLARLDHPCLPKVFDYFLKDGKCYLVMNFIDGTDLLTILRNEGNKGFSEDRVVEWARKTLKILDYLHNQNPPIVYRDIKPSNLMLHQDGRIMLIDFGIARIVRKECVDNPKTVIGTDGYAPLEQYQGKPEPRSDLYALGATMHHLLSGIEPAPLGIDPIKEVRPDISSDLDIIVSKALSELPPGRYSDAKEMLEALKLLEENNRIRKYSLPEEKKRDPRVRKRRKKGSGLYDSIGDSRTAPASYSAPSFNWQGLYREILLGNGLRDIYFTDPENGWAVGDKGIILNTSDGGEHWRKQKSETSYRLNTVYFADKLNGWAGGNNGTILYTGDGGEIWKKQECKTSSAIYGIYFVDFCNGWAVGEDGLILHTKNGGNAGWLAGLLPAGLRGSSWKSQEASAKSNLYGVYFSDSLKGCIAGDGGTILFTRDGGNTWNEQSKGKWLMGLSFADENNGWAAGENGTIFHTKDGGESWIIQETNSSTCFTDIYFINSSNGWAAGGNVDTGEVFFYTKDGGNTWLSKKIPDVVYLAGLHFTDGDRGWIVTYDGKILYTDDGGSTWEPQYTSQKTL